MLIQCHSCDAKYRLNLERIPNRKAFVKCKRCGAPIFIDPQQDAEAERTVAAAAPVAGSGGPDTVMVNCENCGARYRVPTEPLRKHGLKLRCTRCGHRFAPPALAPAAVEGAPAGVVPSPEFYPSAGEPEAGLSADGTEMPVPDDQRMETMFDDLQVEAMGSGEALAGEGEEPSPFGDAFAAQDPDSEQAYLDAVDFERPGGAPSQGSVPDDKKYQFFLKPHPTPSGEEAEFPDLPVPGEGEEGPPELPEIGREAAQIPNGPSGADDPTSPPEPLEGAQTVEDNSIDPNLPALPEEPELPPHPNPPVPGQPGIETRERRIFVGILGVAFLVALAAVGWGWWLSNLPDTTERFAIQSGVAGQFSLNSGKPPYFVTNKASGTRLYVFSGELENRFSTSERVGWVRLRGTAFGKESKPVQAAYSYVGNLLTDEQLVAWNLQAIKAYYGYNNGRNDSNFHLQEGAKVPFQIVFVGVPATVTRAEAEIIGYLRRGKPVYVETFP